MKTASMLLLFTMTAFATAQSKPTGKISTRHFHWSERNAQELDYHRTIATTTDLTSAQKVQLIDLVIARLGAARELNPGMFENVSDQQIRKLASDTRIELADLNADGTKEVIAQANGLGPCGGTGNCLIWVFQPTPSGFRLLLDSSMGKWGGTFEVIRVLPYSSNAFREIVLGNHVSASDRNLVLYRYANGSYKQSDCYYATTSPARRSHSRKYADVSQGCPSE